MEHQLGTNFKAKLKYSVQKSVGKAIPRKQRRGNESKKSGIGRVTWKSEVRVLKKNWKRSEEKELKRREGMSL